MREVGKIFSSLIDDDTDISNTAKFEIVSPSEANHQSDEADKVKEEKQSKPKMVNIPKDCGKYSFKRFEPAIAENVDIKQIQIGDFILRLDESWTELLLFLIGASWNKLELGFIPKAAEYGVFNSCVILHSNHTIYTDIEQKDITLFNIPEIDKVIELRTTSYDFYSEAYRSIFALLRLLDVNKRPISTWLIKKGLSGDILNKATANLNKLMNNALIDSADSNRVKKRVYTSKEIKLEKKELGDSGSRANAVNISILDTNNSEPRLIKSRANAVNISILDTNNSEPRLIKSSLIGMYEIGDYANITLQYIDFGEVGSEVFDFESLGIATLTVLNLLSHENFGEVVFSNAIKDVVGVTMTPSDYYDTAIVAKNIQGTPWYFYTNGLRGSLIKYLIDVIEELEIDLDTIQVTYTLGEKQ